MTAPLAAGRGRRRSGRRERLAGGLSSGLRSGRLPALIVALAGLFVLYGFLLSGDFTVASVVVHGMRLGDPAEVVTTADAIGAPIFEIDARDAADRVARLPYVERVTVRTRFPDEVVITVEERVPVVTWQAGTRSFLVDARGNVLAEAAREELPRVLVEGEPPLVGATLDARRVAAVTAAWESFGDMLAELLWTPGDGLTVRLTDDRSVILGDPERLPLKLAVWEQARSIDQAWSLLDLREPDRPYYK